MTPRPRSRSRSIRSAPAAVCATPRAAVGSSRSTSFGSPSSERAMATDCRWPPESEADRRCARRGSSHRRAGRADPATASPSRSRRGRRPRRLLAAEEEVADDVEVVAEREILVDGGDAESRASVRAADPTGSPLRSRSCRRRQVDAGDHLDQRRLAGAVVADQRHDLARRRPRGRRRSSACTAPKRFEIALDPERAAVAAPSPVRSSSVASITLPPSSGPIPAWHVPRRTRVRTWGQLY